MERAKKIELDYSKLLGLRNVAHLRERRTGVASALGQGAKVGFPKSPPPPPPPSPPPP